MPTLERIRTSNKLHQSQQIMEHTWYRDLAVKTCYFYDWEHDNQKTTLSPKQDKDKIPMDVKFIINSAQTFDKDAITYHIQLKPSQECVVPYYEEVFGERYDATYPVGLYCDIPDSKGKYNRWLVVGLANSNDPMFPTYEVLRCDKVFQWIFDQRKYNVAGVLRSQNSYNSGVWRDFK